MTKICLENGNALCCAKKPSPLSGGTVWAASCAPCGPVSPSRHRFYPSTPVLLSGGTECLGSRSLPKLSGKARGSREALERRSCPCCSRCPVRSAGMGGPARSNGGYLLRQLLGATAANAIRQVLDDAKARLETGLAFLNKKRPADLGKRAVPAEKTQKS